MDTLSFCLTIPAWIYNIVGSKIGFYFALIHFGDVEYITMHILRVFLSFHFKGTHMAPDKFTMLYVISISSFILNIY